MMRSICLLLAIVVAGCKAEQPSKSITLATTTSTRDSGLLDALLPVFRKQTGIEVKVVAVGSGQALELGRRGDADVLLTHSPAAEDKFMAEGSGVDRRAVMYNDFILIGPPGDPAQVKGKKSIAEAFATIAKEQARFVSRGDESGTHQAERRIWKQADVKPEGQWYLQAGAGMGQVIRMADEKRGYTLSDRGTFLAQRKGLDLAILVEGDPLLRNDYSVTLVNPEKHPHVRHDDAKRFADFLVDPETQKLIGQFGVEQFGEPLFFPNAH
jgi:tungstate transport system substrate-binding protein